MTRHRARYISALFAVQLLNSVVHHTTHMQALLGSISVIDVTCTLTLVISLVVLGNLASQAPRPILSGALWAFLLWVFGVCASAAVMRLVDPSSMDTAGLLRAAAAMLVLAPVALALGALGAWRGARRVAA